jgi:hypothetical protein
MLKTVSSITNAIGALNFKGTWNASTNTPTLASGVGTKGDYYVVGVAGATTLDGISTWGVGDWATYNGTVWQRVEGGADLEGVNLNVSGTTNLAALTASTALALDASKNVVSVTNTGTGDNVLATTPTLVGDVTLSTGNLVVSNGKGIDFSATPGTGTSELLADYEEGDWTPVYDTTGTNFTTMTMDVISATYTKIGRQVTVRAFIRTDNVDTTGATGNLRISGLPFTSAANGYSAVAIGFATDWAGNTPLNAYVNDGATTINLMYRTTVAVAGATQSCVPADMTTGASADKNTLIFSATYFA